jgi:DNA-binding CsgD family transcriptional regulator
VDDAKERAVGRDAELDVIEQFLDDIPAGPTHLLIVGEPGIGKTTLVDAAVHGALRRHYRVMTTRPTEAETAFSFAGLIDLMEPFADDVLPTLPPPQRLALEVALLRREAPRPVEPGAISVAMVSAVRALAATSPVMIAVDDVDRLDHPTARVLGFALRRTGTQPVGIAVTCRPGSGWLDTFDRAVGSERVRTLDVGPLALGALYRLIRARLGVPLARPLLVRIHEASAGNPLFALELARASLKGGAPPSPGLPLSVPAELNRLLRARLRRLPPRTRDVLLAAAAVSSPTIERLQRASDVPGGGDAVGALERAERAGVIRIDLGVVRFTHPLLAAALYSDATPSEQRSIHRRIAATSDDAEERARHLALATTAPDESVAEALDEGAARAMARGASGVAAQLAEQALALTPGRSSAVHRRSLVAGGFAASAGDLVRGRELLERAVSSAGPGRDRAEALLQLAEVTAPLRAGIAICDRALAEPGDDPTLRSHIHRTRAYISYHLGDVPEAEDHARIAVQLAEAAGDPTVLSKALAELAHWTFCGGGGIRRDLFERAVGLDGSAGAFSPRSHLATVIVDAGQLAESKPLLEALVAEAMELGDLRAAALHLFHLAENEMWAGNWAAAIEYTDESLMMRQHTDQPSAPLYVKAMSLASLGRLEAARREAEAGRAEAERTEDVVFLMQHLHVLGFLDLSLGDYAAAHAHLGRATDLLRPRWNKEFGDCRFVPDEIEALIALGDLERGGDLVAWMEEVGRRTSRPWTLATGARCRALLNAAGGDLAAAGRAVAASLEAHEHLPMPFELARTLLVKGNLERRAKRWASGRSSLGKALAIFEALGAQIWAGRTRAEIARLGVRGEAQRDLTPVEMRIAHLVADGHTNREIADLLFLSPKTIEANLSRVYRKLDLRSRTDLATWALRTAPSTRS